MKRIVVINFFPAFTPPGSGGARYFYLYEHLSRFHDVTLISHTYPGDGVEMVGTTIISENFGWPRMNSICVYIISWLWRGLALSALLWFALWPERKVLRVTTRFVASCCLPLTALFMNLLTLFFFDTEFEAVERAP